MSLTLPSHFLHKHHHQSARLCPYNTTGARPTCRNPHQWNFSLDHFCREENENFLHTISRFL